MGELAWMLRWCKLALTSQCFAACTLMRKFKKSTPPNWETSFWLWLTLKMGTSKKTSFLWILVSKQQPLTLSWPRADLLPFQYADFRCKQPEQLGENMVNGSIGDCYRPGENNTGPVFDYFWGSEWSYALSVFFLLLTLPSKSDHPPGWHPTMPHTRSSALLPQSPSSSWSWWQDIATRKWLKRWPWLERKHGVKSRCPQKNSASSLVISNTPIEPKCSAILSSSIGIHFMIHSSTHTATTASIQPPEFSWKFFYFMALDRRKSFWFMICYFSACNWN